MVGDFLSMCLGPKCPVFTDGAFCFLGAALGAVGGYPARFLWAPLRGQHGQMALAEGSCKAPGQEIFSPDAPFKTPVAIMRVIPYRSVL